uniref:Uncharacterized protein n=1 Tax=Photinus pyralis TaxID=7054 RepID=A0A1Y1NJ94_PHOPY
MSLHAKFQIFARSGFGCALCVTNGRILYVCLSKTIEDIELLSCFKKNQKNPFPSEDMLEKNEICRFGLYFLRMLFEQLPKNLKKQKLVTKKFGVENINKQKLNTY